MFILKETKKRMEREIVGLQSDISIIQKQLARPVCETCGCIIGEGEKAGDKAIKDVVFPSGIRFPFVNTLYYCKRCYVAPVESSPEKSLAFTMFEFRPFLTDGVFTKIPDNAKVTITWETKE